MMNIEFHKINQKKHILLIIRSDGSVDKRELETKSFLIHDLVHFAIESEANLENGFWGLLSQGISFARLYDSENPFPENTELMKIEALVGPMQSVFKNLLSEELYFEKMKTISPDIITASFITNVLEKMRMLIGHWNATGYGKIMKIKRKPR